MSIIHTKENLDRLNKPKTFEFTVKESVSNGQVSKKIKTQNSESIWWWSKSELN